MIVHIETRVQTLFGVLDDNGNIVNKQPVTLEISELQAERFRHAYDYISNFKARYAESVEQGTQPPQGDGTVQAAD
jgi:hypothetical protein